jgi:hypothetical protein
MLARIHGKINFECDGCAEVLDTETKDFDEAMRVLRGEMWDSQKIGADWAHYCSRCADLPRSLR